MPFNCTITHLTTTYRIYFYAFGNHSHDAYLIGSMLFEPA